MRFVVFGAGAIGGVVGARLARSGHSVVLVARGQHAEVMRRNGLTFESPDERWTIDAPVVDAASLRLREDDVVLLAVKSQHTDAALDALCAAGDARVPIVCLQNGVENERRAARRFAHVYGAVVMCPAAHLEPGVVQAYSSPITGLIDIGRYPTGQTGGTRGDPVAERVAAALAASSFDARVSDAIMRWKYAKLVLNLVNVVDAICTSSPSNEQLVQVLRDEGRAVLATAGIDVASEAEEAERRGDLLTPGAIGDRPRAGASSRQSLARRTGSIETDYLNGEIVLLGRLHGVPTPANEVLQRHAAAIARDRRPPNQLEAADLLREIAQHARA